MVTYYYCHAHGKEFRRLKELESHIRDEARHGTEGRIECPACKQVCATILHLKQHSEQRHGMNFAPVGCSIKSAFGARRSLECPVVGCESIFELWKSHRMLKHVDRRHSGKAAMVQHVKWQYGVLDELPVVATSNLISERIPEDRDDFRRLANMGMDEVFKERREADVQGRILRSLEVQEECESEDESDGGVRVDAGCWDEMPFGSPWD